MARSSKHSAETLLDLAREAVDSNPDIPVATFRVAHGVGSNEAHAALTAAWWERGYRHYGRLTLEQLHPRYQPLVKTPLPQDPAGDITIDSAPEALRLEVDLTLTAARDALGRLGDHLQIVARRVMAEADARVAQDIQAADGASRDLATEIEIAQRHEADARREAASIREELNAEISRLAQGLRDQTRERAAAERARESAEDDRRHAHATLERGREAMERQTADLSGRLADAERVAGATDCQIQMMTDVVADLRRRLDGAVDAVAGGRRDAAMAESRAAAAEARLALLQEMHAAELLRMHEAQGMGAQSPPA